MRRTLGCMPLKHLGARTESRARDGRGRRGGRPRAVCDCENEVVDVDDASEWFDRLTEASRGVFFP